MLFLKFIELQYIPTNENKLIMISMRPYDKTFVSSLVVNTRISFLGYCMYQIQNTHLFYNCSRYTTQSKRLTFTPTLKNTEKVKHPLG